MHVRYTPVVLSILFIIACAVGTAHAWVENGDTISASSDDQIEPQIVSDGLGGSIVSWCDKRGTHTCVYAQRVGPRGHLLWNSEENVDGIIVCDTLFDQSDPRLISDGAGGAIIAWTDKRNPSWDIYALKINPDGIPDTLGTNWQPGGNPICTRNYNQQYLNIVSDHDGGTIISWYDPGLGKISAQRVTGDGTCLWNTNGNEVGASYNHPHAIVPDGTGGAYIAVRYYGIRVYRINSDGVELWQPPKGVIPTEYAYNYNPQIIRSMGDGVIVTWTGSMRSNFGDAILAARVDHLGNISWTPPYTIVSETTIDCGHPQIVEDTSGGGIITWEDHNGTHRDIYAQRINMNGNNLWNPDGVPVCTLPYNQDSPRIAPDGYSGAFVVWHDNRDAKFEIFAQCLNYVGEICPGDTNGIAVCYDIFGNQRSPQIACTDPGTAIIVWTDPRYGESACAIFGAQISTDPCCDIVATMLQDFSRKISGNSITVRWVLSTEGHGMRFYIYRSEGGGAFHELSDVRIIRDGMSFTFEDRDLSSSTNYSYRIDVSDEAGRRKLFETNPIVTPHLPVTLYQNQPNPFNPATTISYYLPEPTNVTLDIFDVSGKRIVRLINEKQNEGLHAVEWRGMNGSGGPVASGVYLYRLRVNKEDLFRKMILLR